MNTSKLTFILALISMSAFAQAPGVNPGLIQPAKFNWCGANETDFSKCTPVKSQGDCGSCWAFATTAVVENLIYLDNPKTVPDLSEQYVLSCNPHIWTVVAGGCSGGFASFNMYTDTFRAPDTEAGAVYEADFPNTYKNVSCDGAPRKHHERLQGWVDLPDWSDVRTIKEHISSYGPIYAEVCANKAFQYYRPGTVFHDSDCGVVPNHAVVIVGWNDNNGDGYWIMRNSWGPYWGNQGYMNIAYGANGIAAHAVAAVYKPRYPLPPTFGCSSTGDAGTGFYLVLEVVIAYVRFSSSRRR